MPANIVLLDYGMGNLRSVERKFSLLKNPIKIISSPKEIEAADKLIIPGVGHFKNAMARLKENNLIDILNEKVLVQKTPVLGICLGLQLFCSFSEEGNVKGLGWINATTKRFNTDTKLFKIPHMGWNTLNIPKDTILLKGVEDDHYFYFVHSYHLESSDDVMLKTTSKYDYNFISAIESENIFGTQFHPEKSHEWGEIVLNNFIRL